MERKQIGLDARKIKDYGIGTYIQNILSRLPGFLPSYSLNLLCCFQDIDFIKDNINKNFFYSPMKAQHYSMREHIILSRIANNLNLQLFHSPHYVVPAFLKCRSIVTIHDVIHLIYPGKGLAQKIAAYLLMKVAIKKAHAIITVSENSKKDIVRFFPEARAKVTAIHNGVDDYFFTCMDTTAVEDIARAYSLPSRYILYVGNHLKHKNIERLVKVFKLFTEHKKDYSLLLVGGIRLNELKQGLNNSEYSKIKTLPYVDKKVLKVIYQKADFLIMPSLYEGFGLPLLEAMACKTAVTCSSINVFQETAQDIPLYFDPENENDMLDSMIKLSENKELREAIAMKGYERAQLFSWQKSAQMHSEVYQEALK